MVGEEKTLQGGEGAAAESKSWPETLAQALVHDVIETMKRARSASTDSARRDVVRVIFCAIDGLLWQLKADVSGYLDVLSPVSSHERSALLEESYSVDAHGNVIPQPRYLPLTVSIRLLVRLVQKYRNNYRLDLGHAGWQNLTRAIKTRNRVTHPKRLDDLAVSEQELQECVTAFKWVLALVNEILRESNTALKIGAMERQDAITAPRGAAITTDSIAPQTPDGVEGPGDQ